MKMFVNDYRFMDFKTTEIGVTSFLKKRGVPLNLIPHFGNRKN